jgi:glycosyltransferase involved in cell wall biosynthesis
MNIELSLCIPTCNRAALLARALDAALREACGQPVEICVSNNASGDATEQLLDSLSAVHPSLRYENRIQNIGIDRNILAALRMARGRYVLPIGDDERLAPGAVASILAELNAGPGLLILNGRYFSNGVPSAPRLPANLAGRTITGLSEAFALLWDQMPLGGFVAPRGYAESAFADRYLGTHHAYSGAIWDYLLDHFVPDQVTAVCTAEPLIEFHRVDKSWAPDAASIFFRQIPRWFDLLPNYYGGPAVTARREFQRRCASIRQLFRFRAARQISRANSNDCLRGFGYFARMRGCAIAMIPSSAAAAALRLAHRLPRWKTT